jgi:Holliday junction resolvase
MQTKKGREYEHTLADLVADATNGELIPLGTGYNSQHSEAVDLIIDDGEAVHAFELKRTSQDAYTLYWDEDDYQKDDLYNLCKFCVEYPRPTYPYVGVRFNRRQLALTKLYINNWPDKDDLLDDAVTLSPIEAKHTGSGNLRFYKPESGDGWPSENLENRDPQHVLDAMAWQL